MALVLVSALPLRAELPAVTFAAKPAHVVLFVIDGLSYKTWEKTDLPTLREMIKSGTLVKQVFLPPPADPHEGAYARLHTCSIPNPILMSGTIFIDEKTVFYNEMFFPQKAAAFVANAIDYRSLLRNYHYVYQKVGSDEEAVNMALEFEKLGQPTFLGMHLQDVGDGGSRSMAERENVPWKNDIWHPQSPYRLNLAKADSLLGEFIKGLAGLGLLESTAVLVVGDHGQADTGWHPVEIWDAAITTAVVWGAGTNSGVVVDYGELIDVGPTICALLGVGPPPTTVGVVFSGALREAATGAAPRPRLQEKMNMGFREFRRTEAAVRSVLESTDSPARGFLSSRLDRIIRSFYGIERFIEWPRFKTVAELVEQNEKALKGLTGLYAQVKPLAEKGK